MAQQNYMDNMSELNGGVANPDAVSAQQDADYERNVTGTSAQQIFGMAQAAGRGIFGNPRVDKAADMQTGVANAISDSDAKADPEEDGLTSQLRRLKATYTAVADKSPQAALQISGKIALLQEAQSQQRKLNAGIDLQNSNIKKSNDLDNIALASQGTYVVGNQKTGKQYGEVHQFDGNGNLDPEYQAKIDKLRADSGDPEAQAVQAKSWWDNKFMLSSQQFQQRLQLQEARAAAQNGLTPGGLNNLVVAHAIFGDGVLSRRPPAERDAVTNAEAAAGISPVDMAQARSEIKANLANAGAQGRREGNVDFLSASVPKLGENLVGAMDGVTRTDYTGLNTLIRLGKTKAISDSGEQVYAAALQSFVSEYARVINGGTGQSTDSAKEEAWAVLGKDSSPSALKAAVRFLSTKEIQALQGATPLALDALRNPEHYKASLRIQQKMGINLLANGDQAGSAGVGVDPDATPQAPPIQPGNGAATPPASGKTYADANAVREDFRAGNISRNQAKAELAKLGMK